MPAQNVNLVNPTITISNNSRNPVPVKIDYPATTNGVNVNISRDTRLFVYYFTVLDSNGQPVHEECLTTYYSLTAVTLRHKAAEVSGWYINMNYATISRTDPVPVTVIVNGESTSELRTAMHDRVVINYLKDSVSDVWKVQSVSYSNYVNTDF